MIRILVVFHTTYGQSQSIARFVADLARKRGAAVQLLSAEKTTRNDVDDANGIVIVAPVYFGRHPAAVRRFLRDQGAALCAVPVAFVSVSSSAASPDPAVRANVERLARRLLADTGVPATLLTTVGGAISYPRYNVLLRAWMKMIARRSGQPTTTSQVHEQTSWSSLRRSFGPFFERLGLPSPVTLVTRDPAAAHGP